MENKSWLKLAGITFLALMLAGIVGGCATDETESSDRVEAEQQTQVKAAQAKKDAELKAKQAEEKAKADAKAAKEQAEKERLANRTSDEKLVDVVKEVLGDDGYREHKVEEGTLWVRVNTNVGWAEKDTLTGIYMDTLKITEAIRDQKLLGDATEVDITFYTPLTDPYGKTEDDVIVEIGLTKETIAKIDFNNMLYKNVPTISDYYWEHPLFSKK